MENTGGVGSMEREVIIMREGLEEAVADKYRALLFLGKSCNLADKPYMMLPGKKL